MAKRNKAETHTRPGSRLGRVIMLGLGILALGLGILGIVVPLLPATPLLLLAGFCFGRSSVKLHQWLYTNPHFGEYLRRYRNRAGIPRRVKIFTLVLLWTSLVISALLALSDNRWQLGLALALIGLAVSIHVLRIPDAASNRSDR